MIESRKRDESLVEAAKGGDTAAFEELVRAYTPLVWAHAMRFFGDPMAAEDVVQEVFIKVLRGLPSFEGRSAFSTWTFSIARTTCIDMMRSARRRPVSPDPIAEVPVPDETGRVDLQVSVEAAMRVLPPEERDALNAVAIFGLGYAEAGEALGVPAGTVKSRVFRARRALTSILKEEGRV